MEDPWLPDLPTFNAADARAPLLAAIDHGPRREDIETERGLAQLRAIAEGLPWALREALSDFRRRSNQAGALLINGLPVDGDLPRTPTATETSRYINLHAAITLGMIASLLGEIFGYMQLDQGALFRSVFPLRSEMWEQSSKGSREALLLHTEQTFHPYRPRHLMLFCLRGDQHAGTRLCSLNAVLPQLSDAEREALSRQQYVTGIDYAFGNTQTAKGNGCVLPVLGGPYNDPVFNYDEDLMIGSNQAATNMLERLRAITRRVSVDVYLQPGQLLLIDNNRAAHGRSRFTPRFDGTDRWLMQVKTLEALPPIGPHREAGTRIVRTRLEPRDVVS